MKIIRLTQLQIFNGIAYHPNEDLVVSDSIAATAAKRGVLDGEAREVKAQSAVVEATVVDEVTAKTASETPVESPTEVPAKSRKSK